jgi:hypothetical protein
MEIFKDKVSLPDGQKKIQTPLSPIRKILSSIAERICIKGCFLGFEELEYFPAGSRMDGQ